MDDQNIKKETAMFKIHMLPADHGDCLWVEYGTATKPKRILIDAGTPGTYPRALRPKIEDTIAKEGSCHFELFVVTHIDADHIGGALQFLGEIDKDKVAINEIWFNGYFHLSNEVPSQLGPDQAERLSALIQDGGWKWNTSFKRRAVMVPDKGVLPQFDVAGMKLTLLSPTLDKLKKLKPKWEAEIKKAGLVPGAAYEVPKEEISNGFLGEDVEDWAATKFKEDKTEANGTSIAFIAEYKGKKVLFSADAHPSVLIESLARKPLSTTLIEIAAFKLPHHASKNNVSASMVASFPSIHYLISTSGAQFKHPDEEAVARVLVSPSSYKKQLHFNYDTEFNAEWKNRSHKMKWSYEAIYGNDLEGLTVEL
jgi:beta-lactamase superfamily II metal-dependent hydrolase